MEADNRQFDGKLFLKDVNRKLNDRLAEIQKDLNQGLKEMKICMNITGKIIRKWISTDMRTMTISRRSYSR